jgi:hypothetical protein
MLSAAHRAAGLQSARLFAMIDECVWGYSRTVTSTTVSELVREQPEGSPDVAQKGRHSRFLAPMRQAEAVGDEEKMARKESKNIVKARAAVTKPAYALAEAVELLKQVKFAKFDETVDLTMRLGVDTRHADQMVRGTVVLPHGLGKTKTVAVIASGDRQKEAQEAGADFVGGEEMVEKIQKENWTAFDEGGWPSG